MRTAIMNFISKRLDRPIGQRDTNPCAQSAEGRQPRSAPERSTRRSRCSILDPVFAKPDTGEDFAGTRNKRLSLSRRLQLRGKLSQPSDESESQVVRGAASQIRALDAIDPRFANRVAVPQRLAGPLADDEDRALRLVRDRLTKAWTGRGRHQQEVRLHAWFFTVLRNTFLSEMNRQQNRLKRANSGFSGHFADNGNDQPTVTLSQFISALAMLPEAEREAIILVSGAGYSIEKAAIACDCSVGTLRGRLFRARTACRAKIWQLQTVRYLDLLLRCAPGNHPAALGHASSAHLAQPRQPAKPTKLLLK
jgi:RNA polymerase sigma-70 factor (ECF subfamily)